MAKLFLVLTMLLVTNKLSVTLRGFLPAGSTCAGLCYPLIKFQELNLVYWIGPCIYLEWYGIIVTIYMYRIHCIKILCDDKVVSPVIHLLHSAVAMSTVCLWSTRFPSDSKPREVTQLNAAIGAVCSEHPTIHLSEPVGKVSLGAFCRDKAETRQCCLILSECTMLDFQGHRLCEFAGCFNPHDRAEEVRILRKLKLPGETCLDVDTALSNVRWKTAFTNMKLQPIFFPLK